MYGALDAVYIGVEDASEDGEPTDYLLSIPVGGGPPAIFTGGVWKPGGLRFSPGGAFGDELHFRSRYPGRRDPLRLLRIPAVTGVPTALMLFEGATEVTGVASIVFGRGDRFGDALYLSTFQDSFSPGSRSAVFRVDAGGLPTSSSAT